MTRRIIRLPEVRKLTGLSQSSIYASITSGTFPAQIPLGGRAVGWYEDEVNVWIEALVTEAKDHASMHIDKAAKELQMLPEELQPFIDSGELPTFKVGRHQLVRKTTLTEFQKKPRNAKSMIRSAVNNSGDAAQ